MLIGAGPANRAAAPAEKIRGGVIMDNRMRRVLGVWCCFVFVFVGLAAAGFCDAGKGPDDEDDNAVLPTWSNDPEWFNEELGSGAAPARGNLPSIREILHLEYTRRLQLRGLWMRDSTRFDRENSARVVRPVRDYEPNHVVRTPNGLMIYDGGADGADQGDYRNYHPNHLNGLAYGAGADDDYVDNGSDYRFDNREAAQLLSGDPEFFSDTLVPRRREIRLSRRLLNPSLSTRLSSPPSRPSVFFPLLHLLRQRLHHLRTSYWSTIAHCSKPY